MCAWSGARREEGGCPHPRSAPKCDPNPLGLQPYNYHHEATIRINYARAKTLYGIQFYSSASGTILLCQVVPPDRLDSAFNAETYGTVWSAEVYRREEARKAIALQTARHEPIADGTIPFIADDGAVGGDPLRATTTVDENVAGVIELVLPNESKAAVQRRLAQSDSSTEVQRWGRATYSWDHQEFVARKAKQSKIGHKDYDLLSVTRGDLMFCFLTPVSHAWGLVKRLMPDATARIGWISTGCWKNDDDECHLGLNTADGEDRPNVEPALPGHAHCPPIVGVMATLSAVDV